MRLPAVLLFFLFTSSLSFSQTLKKKYLGTYSGTIPTYTVDAGGEVVSVKSAEVSFSIDEENVATQTIDAIEVKGRWQLIAVKSDYYEIGFTPENSVALQKYYIFKKGKKAERDGLYPQPDCFLAKK